MTPFLEAAFERYPVMKTAGIKTFFCGPESFTPDGSYLMGESPEVDGLFLATGLNSLGVLSAGGVGQIMAENLLTTGDLSQDITGLDVTRMPTASGDAALSWRAHPEVAWLHLHLRPRCRIGTTRPRAACARLPLHDRYAAMGAYFHDLSGWEMPYWFSPDGPPPKVAVYLRPPALA